MKKLIFALLFLSTLAVGQTDPAASNGSGCVASGIPAYCNKAFTALSTDPANTAAQTQIVDPAPAAYAATDIHSYLYPGNTTRVLMHYQPWFCNSGATCNSHINVGYNENNTATVTAQLADMKALGVDVVVPDYYGSDASKAFNLATIDAMASVIAGSPTLYPKMLLGMDSGAWSNAGQCPKGSGVTTVQMEACIEAQLDFAAVHYFYQSWYEKTAGKPLVTFFLDETSWSSVNWDTVYNHMRAHVAAGQSCGGGCAYTTQLLLLGRNSGDITQVGLDGSFAWSPTQIFNNASPGTQLQWNGTSSYLDNFYTICRANPTKVCIGLLEKGFDDSNASFGTGKIIAQQCGNLPLFTAAKVGSSGYSSASQLAYIQAQTWNDYEEGTEIETGIDNCLSLSASVVGLSLTYTATLTDATYGSLNTVDHFQLLYCSTSVSCSVAPGQGALTPALSGTVSLLTVPPGSWTVRLQAVGKPMIRNQLSNAVNFTVLSPPAPASGLFATVSKLNFKSFLSP